MVEPKSNFISFPYNVLAARNLMQALFNHIQFQPHPNQLKVPQLYSPVLLIFFQEQLIPRNIFPVLPVCLFFPLFVFVEIRFVLQKALLFIVPTIREAIFVYTFSSIQGLLVCALVEFSFKVELVCHWVCTGFSPYIRINGPIELLRVLPLYLLKVGKGKPEVDG